jgi:hypothetical protein
MNSPIQIVWRLSTAIALLAVLAAFAVSGASARIVDDYWRDSAKPILHTGGSIVDPAVRNRLVDDSFRDSTKTAVRTGGSIVDPAVRNRLVDDSFRDPAGAGQSSVGAIPKGYSAEEWNAIQLRSEALNQKYHLGAYRTVNVGGDSAQAERALMLRSDALNRKYHLGRYSIVRPTREPSGFDWNDLGIGVAALIGLALFAGAATLVLRKRRTLAPA